MMMTILLTIRIFLSFTLSINGMPEIHPCREFIVKFVPRHFSTESDVVPKNHDNLVVRVLPKYWLLLPPIFMPIHQEDIITIDISKCYYTVVSINISTSTEPCWLLRTNSNIALPVQNHFGCYNNIHKTITIKTVTSLFLLL